MLRDESENKDVEMRNGTQRRSTVGDVLGVLKDKTPYAVCLAGTVMVTSTSQGCSFNGSSTVNDGDDGIDESFTIKCATKKLI